MKILVVGGGSGGHITPAVAVVREILELKPRTRVEFWTDRKYYKNVVKITTEIGMKWGGDDARKVQYIRVRKIMAGKYHRYAGWKMRDYFEHWDVTLKDLIWGNIKGFCGFVGGLVQSFGRLVKKKTRPDVIFCKGGFVGLPVGLVARLLKIPYVVHESDAVPGLANRMLMKHATVVAYGMPGCTEVCPSGTFRATLAKSSCPAEHTSAQPDKDPREDRSAVWTGIPVAPEYKPVSASKQKSLKKAYGFDPEKPLLVVTGGSQGAENINVAMREILPELLEFTSVGLVVGRKHYEVMVDLKKKYEEWEKAKLQSDFRMWEFCTTMDELMGAADVVVSRAGATTIAELAALKKAVILVPFERLPGSHQVKNADKLEKEGAASVIYDARMLNQPGVLYDEVRRLMRSPRVRADLAEKLHEQARPDAAKKLAEILLHISNYRKV